MKLLILLTVCAISVTLSFQRKHGAEWEEFKNKHAKSYVNDHHHEKRFYYPLNFLK